YQSADDLADDLESFAAGQNIRARRPSIVERVSRWKQRNQKAVSVATIAIAATATLIALVASTWLGMENASMGYLVANSNEGPIVGRLISETGDVHPPFTIPAQQPTRIKEGRYQLQMWAAGRIGQTQQLFVDRGDTTRIDVKLPRRSLVTERTVQGIPHLWNGPQGEDVIYVHENGITRIDCESGKDAWTADAQQLVRSVPTNGSNSISETNYFWSWHFKHQLSYRQRSIPSVTKSSADLNGDAHPDVVVLCHDHPNLLAVDGADGSLLWNYLAGPTDPSGIRKQFSGGLHSAQPIGDIDDDGVMDYLASYYASGISKSRWMDGVSGKTGQRLWRAEMPKEWFDAGKRLIPQACQISALGQHHVRQAMYTGFRWNYYNGSSFRNQRRDLIVPWSAIVTRKNQRGVRCTNKDGKRENDNAVDDGAKNDARAVEEEDAEVLMVCGSRLASWNQRTGTPGRFNKGVAVDLEFFPAMQPRLIQSYSGETLGLLLAEQRSMADTNTGTPARMRFSLWSLETAKEIWHHDSQCDAGWTGTTPDWPLVQDLDGDGDPEIVVADGADLHLSSYNGATCLASIQVLDARTGRPRWPDSDVAKVRNHFRQIQNLVAGPDDDGDEVLDLYVLSVMSQTQSDLANTPHLFIDILSGASGKKLRTVGATLPETSETLDIATPFFWGQANDGSPQIVVSTLRASIVGRRGWTAMLSTGTGEITHYCSQLERTTPIDFRGDGRPGLLTIQPLDTNDLSGAAQMILVPPTSGESSHLIGKRYAAVEDLDGDGVRDLLT
ncbi:MAG: hypothetical protein AAFP90_15390, partial [Planctomycetota bacterium]